MNFQILLKILELANSHGESPEDSMNRAELYRDFLFPKTEEALDTPPVAVKNPAEPGMKRKRRTKEEMLAAREGVTYEDIQSAMIKLFDRGDMDLAKNILAGLGVTSTMDLKKEQYSECLILLQDAMEDGL